MQKELEDGQLVCIFSEGALDGHGEMAPFRAGLANFGFAFRAGGADCAAGLVGFFFSRKMARR